MMKLRENSPASPAYPRGLRKHLGAPIDICILRLVTRSISNSSKKETNRRSSLYVNG